MNMLRTATLSLLLAIPAHAILQAQLAPLPDIGGPSTAPGQTTTIESDSLDVKQFPDDKAVFTFDGNVRVIGTNLIITCDKMIVTSQPKKGDKATDKPSTPGAPSAGSIDKIEGIGRVEISQDGRRASAGRAEVFPNEGTGPRKGKIILYDSPKVTDRNGTLTGHRITLWQSEGRVLVERNPDDKQERPTVIMQGFGTKKFITPGKAQ